MIKQFNWKISGAAGEGIKIAGMILAKTAFRSGYYVHGYTEYPSLIRGGVNTFQVNASTSPVFSQSDKFNLELSLKDKDFAPPKNISALGYSCAKLGLSLKTLLVVIQEVFADKSKPVIELNLKAAKKAYQACPSPAEPVKLKPLNKKIIISGNEAVALGAVAGGLQVFIAYPMTPTTTILHVLAANASRLNLNVHHAEDEIGVINMAIGAAYSGRRVMVATSGGGFDLMTEGLGLAAISETPIVIVLGMRPGPATGMPTWSSQGDLLMAINSSQDEFPRIVLTPGDCDEAFQAGKQAQILAQKYRLPVIILIDKNLGESIYTADLFPNEHQFLNFPQPPKPYLANSYEHNNEGLATETSAERTKQVNRRLLKFSQVLKDSISPQLYGPKNASKTLISWGSNKGPILEALKSLKNTSFIHFPWLWPFPKNKFLNLVNLKSTLFSLECNATGQLAKLIAQETGLKIKNQVLKYDGRPFYPSEIINALC